MLSIQLKKRLLTAFAGFSFLSSLFFFIGFETAILILWFLISFGSLWEWNNLSNQKYKKLLNIVLVFLSCFLCLSYFKNFDNFKNIFTGLLLSYSVAISLNFFNKNLNNKQKVVSFVGFLYIIISCICFFFIAFGLSANKLSFKNYFAFLIFLVPWFTDSFSFIFGKLFGKRKIFPKISPNKTLEGFVFGSLASFAFLIIYCKLTNVPLMSLFLVLAIIGSHLGDLLESYAKRVFGIKDSSNIFPGHGGFLDRFDSLFGVAIIWIIYRLIIGFFN